MSVPAPPPLPLGRSPWVIKTRSVGQNGLSGRIVASDDDRRALAGALDILACNRLAVEYRVMAIGQDRYAVEGRISAALVQTCVATLEPVPEDIEEDFSAAFWPAEEVDVGLPDGEIDLDEETPEPIEHGEIALGRLVYELIAIAMNPFPRSPDAPAEEAAENPASPKPDSPFAALSKLKKP
jgi:uncharacterized metal-binding protein YceD (DUF177 family)